MRNYGGLWGEDEQSNLFKGNNDTGTIIAA